MKLLEVSNISKTYTSSKKVKTQALSNVNFSISEGELVAIMGSSGSGKTTLMNIMAGILEPDGGKILINGQDILSKKSKELSKLRRENIGIVFQNYNLLDSLTVDENIRVPLILDKKEEAVEEKVHAVAKVLGIEQELNKYPYELSGGQQQRVGICRAIINDAKLILADEPTGNLDSKSSKAVMECFKKVNKESGTGLFMVTHDPVTASYCNRVLFLKDGEIVAEINNDGENMLDKIIEGQKEYII